jgi:hypothetical protein
LFLPLPVLAVILSAAKDPEELNEPKPFVPFNPYLSALWRCLFLFPKTVISTEAAHGTS